MLFASADVMLDELIGVVRRHAPQTTAQITGTVLDTVLRHPDHYPVRDLVLARNLAALIGTAVQRLVSVTGEELDGSGQEEPWKDPE